MRSLTVKLPRTLDDLLSRLARKRATTRSAVLREALAAYAGVGAGAGAGAAPPGSALEAAGDLVGSLEGLPADLATNPRHLKDFGK